MLCVVLIVAQLVWHHQRVDYNGSSKQKIPDPPNRREWIDYVVSQRVYFLVEPGFTRHVGGRGSFQEVCDLFEFALLFGLLEDGADIRLRLYQLVVIVWSGLQSTLGNF
jgi:hypothetical protein